MNTYLFLADMVVVPCQRCESILAISLHVLTLASIGSYLSSCVSEWHQEVRCVKSLVRK